MHLSHAAYKSGLVGLLIVVRLPVAAVEPAGRLPNGRLTPFAAGTEVAFSCDRDGIRDICVASADGGGLRRLTSRNEDDGFPSWSPDGAHIAYYAYHGFRTWSIHKMRADGSESQRLTERVGALDAAPHWSPDGQRIAFSSIYGNDEQIWVMNADGSDQRPLDGVSGRGPRWSPDGRRFVYACNCVGNWDIYVMDVDGTDQQQLTTDMGEDMWPSWSPDGKRIAFMSDRDGNREIYVMDADGGAQRRVTHNVVEDWSPEFSADGRWIVYPSLRASGWEIVIMAADGENETILTEGELNGIQPSWRP